MVGVNCSNNKAPGGLIQIQNGSELFIHNSTFENNGGTVVYLYGAFIDLFVKKCNFTKNEATFYYSAIYSKNVTGNVVVQQCLFANNMNSLYLIGTHSQLMDCEFFGDPELLCPGGGNLAVTIQCGTSSIINCTFRDDFDMTISVISTKFNITDSKWYGYGLDKYCLDLDNSKITIVGSHFDADAMVVLNNDNWSNLTVINTSFVNGNRLNGHVFYSGMGTDRVEFINCLFHTSGFLGLTGQMLLKNCTISSYQEPFIPSKFADQIISTKLELLDCVIMGNNVAGDQPFIYLENASFTMINCLYMGNDVKKHIFLNFTTDVTITNVTFYNNSFGNNGDPRNENSLLKVNNTFMKMKNCHFESNNMQGGSLMLVLGSEMRVINTVMSDNYKAGYKERKMISIHDSKTVEFSSSKFINNSGIDIFDVWSSTLLLIDNCLFENNFDDFDIGYTYDVILQRSRCCDVNAGSIQNVNNLRIFRCTCTPCENIFVSVKEL